MFEKRRWRLPTLPHCGAVPSAMGGLTSLFGMGRGEHPRHNHHNKVDLALYVDLYNTVTYWIRKIERRKEPKSIIKLKRTGN